MNMRLDPKLVKEAQQILGQQGTTATVEAALRNVINNNRALSLFQKTMGKSKWRGFKGDGK